jgi:predicted XRE-type DNA-binding protein
VAVRRAQFDMRQAQATADRTTNRQRTGGRRPTVAKFYRSTSRRAAHSGPSIEQSHSSSPKHRLASKVNHLLDEQRLSQLAAAERLGIPQSKVSAIRNYKLHGISLERLMDALIALDQRVTIVVRPRAAQPKEHISVVL